MNTASRTGHWASLLQCLAVGVFATAGLVWLAQASQRTRSGQDLDNWARRTLVADAGTTRDLVGILGNVSLGSIAVAVVVLVTVAFLRGRYLAAAAAVALVGGANVTTQLIKAYFTRAHFENVAVNSLPSGHATVVISLVLAALVVAPSRLRLLISSVGASAITVIGAATIVAGWHRPADLLAAMLVCLIWGCAVLVVWSGLLGGVLRPRRQPHGVLGLVGAVVGSILLVVLGVRPNGGMAGAAEASLVMGVLGLAAAALVGCFGVLSAGFAASTDNWPLRQRPMPLAETPQPQTIGDDENRAQSHRRPGDHRAQ